jgi:superfamily II DNA or RNA helicase
MDLAADLFACDLFDVPAVATAERAIAERNATGKRKGPPPPRPYQSAAVASTVAALASHPSSLVVMATGTGKTNVISYLIERLAGDGGDGDSVAGHRVLILAHRDELIDQAVERVRQVTGERPAVEKGEQWADNGPRRRRVVVSSVQTQVAISRQLGGPRMTRFDPADFSLVVVDEAHHAVAPSYRKVVAHYAQNPELKVVGFTATADRGDGAALGKVFASVAYRYPLFRAAGESCAIGDGWLVPVRQRMAVVRELDLSKVSVNAGELDGKELATVLEYERVLHGVANPTIEIACGLPEGTLVGILERVGRGGDWAGELAKALDGRTRRQTLVFCASVKQADRLAEILNRWVPTAARTVSGDRGRFPPDARRELFHDFGRRRFQFLTNVGIVTEGTDLPGVEVVVMARPTLSRALYEQMVGRSVRPHADIAHALNDVADAQARVALIAASPKPFAEVVDLAGNAGRHKLVTVADVLGGDYSEDVRARAAKKARKDAANGVPADVAELLRLSKEELDTEQRKKQLAEDRERDRRARVVAQVDYRTTPVDPFDLYDVKPPRERTYERLKPPTEGQVRFLDRYGIDASKTSAGEAGRLIEQLKGKLTHAQGKVLARVGFKPDEIRNLSPQHASRLIDECKANGWKRPQSGTADPLDMPVGVMAGEV